MSGRLYYYFCTVGLVGEERQGRRYTLHISYYGERSRLAAIAKKLRDLARRERLISDDPELVSTNVARKRGVRGRDEHALHYDLAKNIQQKAEEETRRKDDDDLMRMMIIMRP